MSNDRIQIDYSLTFTTPFHFGTGLRAGLIDRSVRRNADGYLYVPGSTLKGIIREHCERLARLIDPDNKHIDRIASPHNAEIALKDLYESENTTVISEIFGSQCRPGLIFFDDARQPDEALELYDSQGQNEKKGKYQNAQTDTYTQVRLDRITRTSVAGALYTSEFGLRNLSFIGSISGWLPNTPIEGLDGISHALLLLLAGLLIVDRVGGNKSTGKGACTLEITQIIVNKETYSKDKWETWLDHLEKLKVSKGAQQ